MARPARSARTTREPAAADAPLHLARQVRELRTARAMTQRTLAAKAGIQQAEISRIEAGKANPTLSTMAMLARALGAELAVGAGGPGSVVERARPPKRTKFLCLVCADTLLEEMTRHQAERHLAEYRPVTERLRKDGQLVACHRLVSAERAATVRVRRGKVLVSDGPFAETKELVGGYFVVEARDRAEAVRIAATLPGARIGCVEVRAIAEDPPTLRALGLAPASPRRALTAGVDPGRARSSRG